MNPQLINARFPLFLFPLSLSPSLCPFTGGGSSINKPGNANTNNNNNNLPPSYSPPSRSFFTPPLPPEYSNPFADKPTLRGTPNENQLLLLSGQAPPAIDYSSHHQALNRGRPNLPPPPAVPVPQQPFEKKVLNTPSNAGQSSVLVNQLNHFLLSTTAAPGGIQSPSAGNPIGAGGGGNAGSGSGGGGGGGGGSSNSVLHIPSISRILSGSNGRKEDFPEVLLRKATIKPNVGKMHTTTVKMARNTTTANTSAASPASASSASSSSQGTSTVRNFLGADSEHGSDDVGIEGNTEEIELDEQLNKNLLVLLKNNKNGDGEEEEEDGEEGADGHANGDGVLMEPSDGKLGKGGVFENQFGGGGRGGADNNLWSILWNFHIYLTAILFTVISVYSIFKIIFYDKLIYLFSQKFFLMIYCLIIMISLIRIYYLCYDPYNINASFPYLLNDFFLNFPQFLMTILLVLLIYYLIVKIYFNDLLMLVRGTGDWDERLMMSGGSAGEDEDEERGGGQFKRTALDKKHKIALDGQNSNSNNSNEDNNHTDAAGDEDNAAAQQPPQSQAQTTNDPQASPDSNLDNHHQHPFYLSPTAAEEKAAQKERELEYGYFLVYFLKNFYKKNARFFHLVLAMNVVLLLVFVTLFLVFYVKLRLSLNANLLLVFVKCFVQFLNLNLILTYFHIYKKLKLVLNRFKMRIISVMNSGGGGGGGVGDSMGQTGGGDDKLMGGVGGGNKMLISDSHDANLMSSGVSSSGDGSHGTGSSDSQATYSRAILGTSSGGGHGGIAGGVGGGHDTNSNTNLVQTFQRTFNRMNYLVFIKNLFNAINITIGIIMLYLLFIIINLLYFVYYYYYYYANASGRMESSDLQHNNLIFDKEKLNNIFLIKFNWLEWSYQFSNRLIELTILILFIWALNIKFVSSNSKRFFGGVGGGTSSGHSGKKGGGGVAGHSPGHIHRDDLIDNENFIMNMNKHQVVSYNTNNNQVELMAGGGHVGGGGGHGVVVAGGPPDDVLLDNEYENPINIYQQLANSQRGGYYGVNKNYQGYTYQEPVGMPGPGPLPHHHHHAGPGMMMMNPQQMMTMNPSNTTMFNSINVRNNEFRASKNLKQFKSTNSLSTNNLNSNTSCSNSTVMNNYRQQQQQQQQPQAQPGYHHHHHAGQQQPQPLPPHHPSHAGPGGNNFYDVINPSSQQGSNYYYSLRNPGSHHSMAVSGNGVDMGSDHYGDGSGGGGYDHEGVYQGGNGQRSTKKGHTAKNRTRKKKTTNPRHGNEHLHHNHPQQQQHPGMMMDQGILPGLITHEGGPDANNFDYPDAEAMAKRGSGNKMLVDDNGFLRFKEFEERNNDSGVIMGGGEYGEHQPHQQMMGGGGGVGGGLETMGSKRGGYNQQQQQRTPYHQSQQQQQQQHQMPHPSSSHELNDFFGDNGNVLCRDN